MANSSIIIESTDTNGVAKAKAISNINSAATGAQLQEFAQRITALTTNQYTGASVITKCDVTEYSSGGSSSSSTGLLNPNLHAERVVDQTTPIATCIVTWDGDGECFFVNGQGLTRVVKGSEAQYQATKPAFVLTSDGVYARDWIAVE